MNAKTCKYLKSMALLSLTLDPAKPNLVQCLLLCSIQKLDIREKFAEVPPCVDNNACKKHAIISSYSKTKKDNNYNYLQSVL